MRGIVLGFLLALWSIGAAQAQAACPSDKPLQAADGACYACSESQEIKTLSGRCSAVCPQREEKGSWKSDGRQGAYCVLKKEAATAAGKAAEVIGHKIGRVRSFSLESAVMDSMAIESTPQKVYPAGIVVAGSPYYVVADGSLSRGYPQEYRDNYAHAEENAVKQAAAEPVSTFSIDVDTAAYANVRRFLTGGHLPAADAVRIEEMVNYFPYDYALPQNKERPFAIHTTLTQAPWKPGNQLLHIGIKGYELAEKEKKPLNLVFLLDTSGSMDEPDKLPLLKQSMNLLIDQLTKDDTVAIVTYAGSSEVALLPTSGDKKTEIRQALDKLRAYGGTWGAGGLAKAYALAKDNYNPKAVNRILLGTDGDFNIGNTNEMSLEDFVKKEKENGVYLSVLGFGRGNFNDSLSQKIAQAGNGNAYYIDSLAEAKKVLLDEVSKTLFPIANDVKIQVEFNPRQVAEYRLIGYETRLLNREDFNNDAVDAGDIGAGHSVTALYELTPAAGAPRLVDDLRYGAKEKKKEAASDEVAFVKVRYKLPGQSKSLLIEQAVADSVKLEKTSEEVRFSIAVAGFAQNLKQSKFKGAWANKDIKAFARKALGQDDYGYRAEFLKLIDLADIAKTERGF